MAKQLEKTRPYRRGQQVHLHGLDKDALVKYDINAESLGFRSRSELMRYMIDYFNDKYDYFSTNDATIYMIVEYSVGSYTGQDLVNMQQRFKEMKIINNEKVDDLYHMVIMIRSTPTVINKIVRMFLRIRDIHKFKVLIM